MPSIPKRMIAYVTQNVMSNTKSPATSASSEMNTAVRHSFLRQAFSQAIIRSLAMLHSLIPASGGLASHSRVLFRLQNVARVAVRMFHQIFLMIILGVIKFRRGGYLGRDGPVELAGFVPAHFHALGRLFLRLAGVENRRAILRAHVIVLPVERGRIVHAEEIIQQFLVAELARVKHHLDRFRVAGFAGA